MNQKYFYHYTKFINKIKKDKKLLAMSYPKTNFYDSVLDFCPKVLLNEKEIEKLLNYKQKNKKLVKRYRDEWKKGKSSLSTYRDLKLKHKTEILDEFFKNKRYILAFRELFEKGWVKNAKNKKYSKASAVFLKTSNEYIKFHITENQFRKSFVLEQKYWKYWRSGNINNLMSKKYGINWWNKYLKYDNLFYEKNALTKEGKDFMEFFIKNTFGKCYLSIKRLKDYKKGKFEVPEFWIYGNINLSKCEFGKVDSKIFKQKTGYS